MTALAVVLDAGGSEVGRLMDAVERRMQAQVGGYGSLLGDLASETLVAGGKRLRPLLVCLSAGVPPPEDAGLVSAAVAVELVHAATLVHDDVLDGSSLRRGRPTVVASAGRRGATATGDLLFSRAFAELTDAGSIAAVRTLSRASSELVEGELMQRADAWDVEVSIERYLERCRLKTAVLFRAACELGAIEGGLDGGAVEMLGSFGEQLGIAFQLLDDVLDVSGPASRTGKPQGADLLDGTVTLPLIIARTRNPELGRLELRGVESEEEALEACERIIATGALDDARARAHVLVREAKSLTVALPERQHHVLELVADGVAERYA